MQICKKIVHKLNYIVVVQGGEGFLSFLGDGRVLF